MSYTSEIMEAYEAQPKNKGNLPNTIQLYTRIHRAVYNRAVEDEIIENHNLFRHVYTGVDKYPDNSTQLLLTIIKSAGYDERCAYRNAGYNITVSVTLIYI